MIANIDSNVGRYNARGQAPRRVVPVRRFSRGGSKKTTTDESVAVWCEKCQTKDRLAHASCLAKYAARVADGVDDFRGWERCKGCTQEFQGAAKVAAARLCWKEYAGRHESDQLRCWAAEALGCALYADGQYEDARDTFLAHLKVIKTQGQTWQDTEKPLAMTRENLAKCAHALGRLDELLAMRREMYAETSAKHFVTDQRTIDAALNLASALLSSDETEEAQKFCRETLRKLKRGCPPNDARVVTLTCALAQTLYDPAAQDRDYLMQDVQEAETLLMEALQASRQAFGAAHTQTARVRQELDAVRAARKGDAVDGSQLVRGPIVLDDPKDDGDEKTIDSID